MYIFLKSWYKFSNHTFLNMTVKIVWYYFVSMYNKVYRHSTVPIYW